MFQPHKPRILLTGATGLIGSAVLKHMAEWPVLLPVRHVNRLPALSGDIRAVEFDLSAISRQSMKTIEAFAPEVVIHCAWIGTTNRDRNLAHTIIPNLESSLKLFDITRRAGCRKWIAIGSQDEYSQGIIQDITEDSPTYTQTIYGNTKLAVCHALQALSIAHGVEFIWLRSFACYGKEYKPEFMIPYVIDCLKKHELPMLKTPHAKWDYYHVDDAARALLMLAQTPSVAGIYNLGSGRECSVAEIALYLTKLLLPSRLGELKDEIASNTTPATRRVASVKKLEDTIGWRAEISLEEGLQRCL